MCDVEKAIRSNQSEDNDDDQDDREQQQQKHPHHQHEDDDDEEQLHLNDATDVKSTALATSSNNNGTKRCLGQLLKILLSSPGLVILVTGYSVLGALIFPLLEAPQDLSKSAVIAKSREDCLRELWIITEKLNVLYERNWTMLVHEQLRRFEGSIVAATRPGGGGGATSAQLAAGGASALGHFGYDTFTGDTHSWTFSEALLYSVTVITTIGHGSLTPRTAAGKLATIFYALFGVPLMLMCLSSLGALLAEALQCTYIRLCCQLQRTSGDSGSEKKTSATGAMTKRRHSASNGANCKGCKYDVANSETSLNECYEYGQKTTTSSSMKRKLSLEHAEDACQLLHNAMPSKLNHQQQKQQQQQFYQQQHQPDVMLMTTTTNGNTLLKYAPLPQQHQHNQQQQQQQQQSLHYINAASQQQQQQLSTATLPRQQQQPQNFVAVPSSMLRFSGPSTLPLTAAAAAGPPNCYAPATATIYFPFAPATSSPVHAAATNCHQPLVKYHTIHLQPSAKHQHRLLTTIDATAQSDDMVATTSTLESITLPPPPAYQTANTHAVRRAKFVTQPLAHEINPLLNVGGTTAAGSSDLSCRHDLLPHALSTTASAAASAAAAITATGTTATTSIMQLSAGIKTTATMPDNSFIAAGVCDVGFGVRATATAAMAKTVPTTTTTSTAATLSALLSSSGNVDIMEDEDEQERERSSNCPHGTPSRVPLIASSGCSPLSLPHELPLAEKSNSGSGASNPARGLLNATAASFHRHTLQPLNRKTMLLTRRCQKHATELYDATANTETSDDEEYMQHGSEQFVLKKLKHSRSRSSVADSQECLDHHELDDEDDEYELQRQVPISLVLLLLMCYICVGTVVFALWENWSLVDGAYFCFVTLSTIGYGDFVPSRSFNGPELQLYACCAYLLLGLVLVAMSFSILETQLMWKCKRIAVRLKLASD
ncbi:ataxin-2 homolog [Drosophila nasuta]|uniref:ataxin-2 homolog n=1 Tax=Drosophila nasuta TaxID=42062 RepID=UPI00295EA93F|nr:ataxin-2 homolog [Drosophila nasuta]XP_060654096.1 ataxin-2 homolog [Drosophila nasuta]XP_060654097.1 ataxin-2 homolog [Drosophila nasuta]XP_060654098.1 ataxin-2 homolog [Drosophila nasuta]